MTKKVINIIKLCVGAQNVSELYSWQKNRIISVANLEDPVTFIITRMRPKKEEELLNGGSIYWVFKGLILARQKIIGFDNIIGADNILFPERFNDMMADYLSHVRSKSNVQSVTIPIDNGEEVTIKISE